VALLQASGIWHFKSGPTFGSVVRGLYLLVEHRQNLATEGGVECWNIRGEKKRTHQTSLGNPVSAGDRHIFGTIEGLLNIGGFGCWAMAWQIPKGFINRQDANNQIRSDKHPEGDANNQIKHFFKKNYLWDGHLHVDSLNAHCLYRFDH
jgi:hypothetical protein